MLFWMWKLRRPHRRHKVWDLSLRLPAHKQQHSPGGRKGAARHHTPAPHPAAASHCGPTSLPRSR